MWMTDPIPATTHQPMVEPAMIREFVDADGLHWHAIGVEELVSHARIGARLAFRSADEGPAPTFPTGVTFNSREAADFALRTLSERELRRRLGLARATANLDAGSNAV